MALDERDRAILDLEREWCVLEGRKDDEIRARFSMSARTYYRLVQSLLDRPDAYDYDPLTVKRLRRDRDERRRARIEGRQAGRGRH